MSESITSFLQLFISKGLPFAVYRLPGLNPVFVAQRSGKVEKRVLSELDKLEGFVVAEFAQKEEGAVEYIRPDIVLKAEVLPKGLLKEVETLPDVFEPLSKGDYSQSKKDYLETVEKIIIRLQSKELQKVVLSRLVKVETGLLDKGKFFDQLEQKYPDTFVYLMHLPGRGTWAGATPETLLCVNSDFVETVALAGTTPVDKISWTEKEKEEQEMVAAYIEEALKEVGIHNFEKSGPDTVRAGKLAHLKTSFKIPIEQLAGKTGSFLGRLHPTPAVCGLPKNKAFDLIQQVEKHDRGLYTGFLGPWNLNGKSHLFVNLRCAQLEKSSIRIFVGGGITAKSNAEAEWEETVNKSETLLSVLKKL